MKRAVVLSGGGARGAFQVGMLKQLVIEQGLDFQVIRGVSVGSLNAAFLAQASTEGDSHANLKERVVALERLWVDEIQGNDSIYDKRLGGFLGLAAGKDSLNDFDALAGLIERYVDIEALRSSGRDFRIGTVSLVSGRYIPFGPTDRDFHQLLLASSAIPVLFPFQDRQRESDVLVDGGVRNITPLSSAFEALPEEIHVLLASRLVRDPDGGFPDSSTHVQDYDQWDDNFLGTKVNGIDVLKRTLDILTDEVYLDDIRNAMKWNRVCASIRDLKEAADPALKPAFAHVEGVLADERRRLVGLNVIAPHDWFGDANDAMEFDPDLIQTAIAHGESVASDPSRWFLRASQLA